MLQWPESRRRELASVRLQLLASKGPEELTSEQRRLGEEMRRLRVEMMAAFGELRACRTCARGHELPRGRWEGGFCCGTTTERLFTRDEIAALRAGGTEPRHLRTPSGDHAGCAFRGKRGCSLAPEHRPGICVRHVCAALEQESRVRGNYERICALRRRMLEVFDEFRQVERLGATSTCPVGR